MATPLRPIECSAQPLCFSFHPQKDIVAAGLVDGTLEVHDLVAKKQAKQSGGRDDVSSDDSDDSEDDDYDTILSTIYVAKRKQQAAASSSTTSPTPSASKKATQGPSCRDVLFSGAANQTTGSRGGGGGEFLYTVCNGGSLRCLDSELACSILDQSADDDDVASSPAILWSIE